MDRRGEYERRGEETRDHYYHHDDRDRDGDDYRRKRQKSGDEDHDRDWRSRRGDDWRQDRDRDRDREGHRHRDGGRDRDHYGRREHSRGGDSKEPTPVVVLRNLHPDTTQDKILYTLKAYGPVNDVRLIRDKVTGESRGFAFVEFPSVDDAQRFMEYHNTRLAIDDRIVYMDYSKQKDSQHHSNEYRDWICPQCNTTNFSRRTVCYRCQAPKPPNPVFVSQNTEDTAEPSPVLALRGLDPSSVEATVYAVLSEYAPIKEVRLVREKGTNVSRGLCFVEFHSVEEATYVLHSCQQGLHIDGCPVRLGYARKNQPERHHSQHKHQAGFANAALEQAQWAAAQTHADAAQQAQWNEIGFYYDAQSGYYYNATTGYSYHPTTQTYYSFDPATQALVAVAPEVALAALPLPATATATTTAAAVESSAAATEGGATTQLAAAQEAEKAAKKEKKRKAAKSIRDKKMSQELERWMKKTQELKHDDEQSTSTAASTGKITISFGATNRLIAGDSAATGSAPVGAHEEAVDSSPLPPAVSQFVVISSGNAAPPQEATTTPAASSAQPPAVSTAAVQEATSASADLAQAALTASPAGAAPKARFPAQSARPDVGLEFVCLVCRCKFARARTLDLHKLQSKLHKDNMEEAHEAEVEQIRELTRVQQKAKSDHAHHHGSGGGKKQRQQRESAAAATTTASAAMSAAAAGVALGEGIGGQMLKRMGWKQGEGLGKDAAGQVNPVEVTRRAERAGLGAEDDGTGDVELDPNDTYQDVAKKKARARLESMMHYTT